MNPRRWNVFSSNPPSPSDSDVIEALYKGSEIPVVINLYHYADPAVGSRWGHSTGSYREGTYQKFHENYSLWRYIGPPVPGVMEQWDSQAIYVWEFRKAPGELRALSDHGGDEDWVLLLLRGEEVPSWCDNTSFGHCRVSEHELPDGRKVLIGAHA